MASFSAPSAPRRSRRALLAALMLALLTVSSLLPVTVFAAPASAAPRLDVVLSGRFDGPEHTVVIAATVSPKAFSSATTTPPPTLPVIFTAGCTDASPCRSGDGTLVSWDFGDGERVTTDKLAVAHPYREPGVYTVRVQVSTATGVGEDEVKVLVSPRYADADADLADKPGRPDREAIWAASALGLLTPCRPAFPSVDGVDPSSTDVNRGVFCPEPAASYGPSGTAPTMPDAATGNGLSGVSCLSSWEACGLPVEAFSAGTGNPQASCGASCVAALRTQGFLDASNRLAYVPTNCLDGWAAVRKDGSWVVVPGTEPGCVSRSDFYSALVVALDGDDDSSSRMLAPESICVDAATSPGAVQMRRASALGLPVAHDRAGQPYCDGAMAVTKSEVYTALAAATGLPEAAPTGLRDLGDASLGRGKGAPHPAAGALGALLAHGAVLVGSTSCADGVGSCFVPGEAVTRSQLSSLMAGLFVGMPSLASGLQVGISPSVNPVAVGSPVELKLNVRVPASYPADAPVTVSWPPTAPGVSVRNCPDTQVLVAGPDRVAELTCSYTRYVPGTTALAVSVTDASGNVATASVPLIVTNSSPVLTAVEVPAFDEDTTGQVTIPATDPEGAPLTFRVRSALPSESTPRSFPLTGRTPTLAWSPEAEVAVGTVRVVPGESGTTVLVTPDRDVYGPYSFAVEVCDSSTCSTQTVSGTVRPVNDAPQPGALVGASGSRSDPFTVKLSGSDPADEDREGYSDAGIDLYRIDSLPATGVLRYDADPGSGTNYVAASAGATTNNPVLRYEPASGSAGPEVTEFFTFSVRDGGHPSSLWSTSSGTAALIVKG